MKKTLIFLLMTLMVLSFAACAAEHEPMPVSPEIAERFPEYCSLDETEGLCVYVWQMGHESYSFGLLSGDPEAHELSEVWNLKTARAEDMKEILASYSLPRKEIKVIPFQNPLSSYIPRIWVYDENGKLIQTEDDYIEKIREMLEID